MWMGIQERQFQEMFQIQTHLRIPVPEQRLLIQEGDQETAPRADRIMVPAEVLRADRVKRIQIPPVPAAMAAVLRPPGAEPQINRTEK